MSSKQVFCDKCHQLAATLKETEDKVEVIQGGKTLINLSKGSGSSISVRCPGSHNVRLEL